MARKPEVTLCDTPHCSLIGQLTRARGSDQPIAEFLGVPYAAPPVRERRFRPPAPLELWSGSRHADQHGPACFQDQERAERTYGSLPNKAKHYSEDCLYLNIWTPACRENSRPLSITQSARLPVMVWIHGGAFVQGYSNIYEGSPLAAYEDVVVISINYRVGVFGFLQTGDGPLDYHGNQGLLDQLEALRWIQKYIKYFGGDPNNVTLFGQSAGGMSISFHLVSPDTSDLYHRVVIQSGPGIVPNSAWPKAGGLKYWWKRIHSMGFEGRDSAALVSFLSNQSSERLLEVFNDWFMPQVIDGTYIPEDVLVAFRHGRFHGKDCMIGFNSTEGAEFVPPNIDTRDKAEQAIRQLVEKNFFRGYSKWFTEEVCRLSWAEYLDTSNGNYQSDVTDFYGDVNFVAPSILQAQYNAGKGCVYMYLFDHRVVYSQHPDWVRADHGNEISYMYGYPFMDAIPDIWSPQDKVICRTLMKFWANFAKTGNPNGVLGEEVLWHQYTPASPYYLHIVDDNTRSRHIHDLWPSRIKLWNHTVPNLLAQTSPNKAKY